MVSTHPTYPSLVSSIWRFFPLPIQPNGFDLCFKKTTSPTNFTNLKNKRAHDRLELHNGTNGIILAQKKWETIARPKLSKIMATAGSKHQPIAKIVVSEKRFQHGNQQK